MIQTTLHLNIYITARAPRCVSTPAPSLQRALWALLCGSNQEQQRRRALVIQDHKMQRGIRPGVFFHSVSASVAGRYLFTTKSA